VLAATDPLRLRGDAKRAYDDVVASGIAVEAFDAGALATAEVVVDALVGTGTRLPLSAELAAVVAAINACGRPVFALDLPSGLDADTGAAPDAVRADATVSFVALKTGLFVGDGPAKVGNLYFDDLELPSPDPLVDRPRLLRLTDGDVATALPARPRNSHKSSFGRVLLFGGGAGMPGAVRLAAEAALRVGAGLVRVASLPAHLGVVVGACPEVMFESLPDASRIAALLADADVVAVGPGLGRDAWARDVFAAVLASRRADQPLIVDADALNLLAESDARCDHWVLTPHPGEAGRLLGRGAADIQQDRLGSLDALVARRGGTIVLKGAGTLVGSPGEVPLLCERGNPGMAVPGMGDVLTGAIAGIIAQCRDVRVGTRAAVMVHATAGDTVARAGGERGMLAGEVVRELRNAVNRAASRWS
jgi:ADP-dependent NAD(P)H-hydrate dehydratase / NAD(P)H-hydrate epimerase